MKLNILDVPCRFNCEMNICNSILIKTFFVGPRLFQHTRTHIHKNTPTHTHMYVCMGLFLRRSCQTELNNLYIEQDQPNGKPQSFD